MPRPSKCRRVCAMPLTEGFVPLGKSVGGDAGTVIMSVDEYEVIRLIDLESMTQEQCAEQMDIARTTVTGIYESARMKLADALVNRKRLIIEGGHFRICGEHKIGCCGQGCRRGGRQQKV